MNIFRFFKNKRCIKIFSKTYQIIPFNEIFSGKHAPELPSKRLATPRVAQPPQKPLSKRTKLNHLKKKIWEVCPQTPLETARSFAAHNMPLHGMYSQNPRF